MSIKSIAFTMYPVTDMKRAVAFYRDALGLKPGEVQADAWFEFDVDGATFGIGNFQQVGKAGTANSLILEVDDIDASRAELAKRGVQVGEPFPLPNCRLSLLDDPDGNHLWLHQRNKHT